MADHATDTTRQDASNLEKFGYKQTLNRVLPLRSLVFYGLAYLAPVTIFSTYGPVQVQTHGMLAFAYLIATVGMLFTALSYSHMSKAFPVAGSVYSYVQRSISSHLGFLSGWAILMDYLLLPMINFLLAGIYLHVAFPMIPNWVFIVAYIAIVTVINLMGIQLTSWVNNGLIIIQTIFVLFFVIIAVKFVIGGGGAGTLLDTSAFVNLDELKILGDGSGMGGMAVIFGGASILCLSFLGFDAVTTVSEEAINPEKNIGRAIIITCLAAGVIFILVSYVFQLAWPTGWQEFVASDSGSAELIERIGKSFMVYLFTAVYCVGCFASAVASQSSAARLLYGMGRDGALPRKFFAHLNEKRKVPSYNVILIGVISLVGIFLSLDLAVSLINFGALAGFALVNICVIVYYFVKKKQRSGLSIVKYLILPAIGAIVCIAIWISLATDAKILGFIWLGVGVVLLAVITNFFRKPPVDLQMSE
ncbi:MAG: APC family permease [Clostridiales Family XIII bacterium]|jgi:amino acid transporter|nr:APC family permease [Clostridiales Family XIII bacterium]